MIQLHYKVTWCPPPDARCRHSGQMSITEMTVCVTRTASVRRNKLTLRWPWLKSGGSRQPITTWMSLHISCPLCVSESLAVENKVRLMKADGSLEKQAIMRRSSALCHWQWGKQKALLSSPVGGLFLFFFFFFCGVFVMDNCPPHMIS